MSSPHPFARPSLTTACLSVQVMTVLILVRNYQPAHEMIISGGWDVAAVARDSYDIEGKVVGTIGAGRIGFRVLQRLKPFNCAKMLYYDYAELPAEAAKEVGAERVEDLKDFLGQCDLVMLNCPLHESTKRMINKETLGHMKKGAWLVNTVSHSRTRLLPVSLSLTHLSDFDRRAGRCAWRRTSLRRLRLARLLATAGTCGRPSLRPRITPGARCAARTATATPWFPTW